MRYILVAYSTPNVGDAAELCQELEQHPNIDVAVLVREASVMSNVDPGDVYVGTMWTTPRAKERIIG